MNLTIICTVFVNAKILIDFFRTFFSLSAISAEMGIANLNLDSLLSGKAGIL